MSSDRYAHLAKYNEQRHAASQYGKAQIGDTFGRLTLITKESDRNLNRGKCKLRYWLVRCSCGTEKTVRCDRLLNGDTRSCGCLAKELSSERGKKRKGVASRASRVTGRVAWTSMPEYQSYRAMKARCLDPNSDKYPKYGAIGITICDRWLHGDGDKRGFECFYEDMGPRPDGCTIDRIDNSLGYFAENCRWLDAKGQANNTKRNRYITVGGKTMSIAEASETYRIGYNKLIHRINAGVPPEQAVAA